MNRTKRQIEAVQKWIKNKHFGTLAFTTGVGKTNTAIIAIKKLAKSNLIKTVHIVVPTKYLKTQWEERLLEQKIDKIINVYVYVINTFIKHKNISCDLLIIDEAHRACSDLRAEIFKFNYKYLLCLTATPRRKDNRHLKLLKYAPIVDSINITEATENNYVSDFIIYNLGLTLTPDELTEYQKINKNFHKHFAVFGRNFDLAMKCLSDKQTRINYAKQYGCDEQWIGFNAMRFLQTMKSREKFIHNFPRKLQVAASIINTFDKKTITFSESIETAEELSNMLDTLAVPYHSKMTKKQQEASLDLFNNNSLYRVMNTSKMLDEGFDVGDIEMGIVLSSKSVELIDTQRRGRLIRFRPGKVAVMVNIYIKDTKDEDWLRERQRNAINVKWIEDVSEIRFKRLGNETISSDSGGYNQYMYSITSN